LLISAIASIVQLLTGSWLPLLGVGVGIWWRWPDWKLKRAIAKEASAAARRGDLETAFTARRELGRGGPLRRSRAGRGRQAA
jgi:hypothetical protein